MLSIGDLAVHQKTGQQGKVIGYGHEILNNVYQTTLKVRLLYPNGSTQKGEIKEDLFSAWTPILAH